MLHELEQLKALVLEGGFDNISKAHVQQLETRLQKLAEAERVKDLPVIRAFTDYMAGEIRRCELLLKSDESLTDLQRNKLFAIIQVSERYTRLFTGEALRKLEADIKRELDHARSQ